MDSLSNPYLWYSIDRVKSSKQVKSTTSQGTLDPEGPGTKSGKRVEKKSGSGVQFMHSR